MAPDKSSLGIKFRGIARSLWIVLVVLMAAMLTAAWFRPPSEGFTAYARKIMLTLIVCFVLTPLVTTGVLSVVGWITKNKVELPGDK